MALYDQEVARNNGTPNYQHLKRAVKLHIDQMMRTRKFRVRSDVVEGGSVTRSQKGKPTMRGKWECFQECSRGDSCSFSHEGRSSSLPSHSKAKQTDGEGQKSSQGSGSKHENSLDKSEIPCRFKLCKNPSCKFWHLPVCLGCRSEKGCVHGDKCHFRHVEGRRKAQQKVKERWCKRTSCDIVGVYTIGLCISRFLSDKVCST